MSWAASGRGNGIVAGRSTRSLGLRGHMPQGSFKCQQCGGPKQLYFVRGPARLTFTLAVLVAVFAYGLFVANDVGLRLAVMFLGAVVAAIPLVTLLRLRCPICAELGRERIWGGL